MLEKIGCRCEMVSDGRQAIDAVAGTQYDAIFMDCQMPDMDGYEAAAAIRATEGEARHTPIIALTANVMAGDRDRCISAGMDDYLPKPIRSADLARILCKWAPETALALTPAGLAPSPPPKSMSAFNPKRLQEVCGSDADFTMQLVQSFLANSRARMQQLRDAIDDRDAAGSKVPRALAVRGGGKCGSRCVCRGCGTD